MSESCFHCLEPVPAGFNASVEINGESNPVCCIGCQAVAETIIAQGMTDYYKFRTESAGKVEQLIPDQLALIKSYDNQDIQADFVTQLGDNNEVLLSVEGIRCAACAWLIEKQLLANKAVKRVDVNTANHRATLVWDNNQSALSELLQSLHQIGYKAYPFQPDLEAKYKQEKARGYVRRLGVAGLMTMQVMMFAFAMYFGMFSGMEDNFEQYFRWISLVLATPVVFYSALPFLTSALSGLGNRHLNMDVPVSLAIFGAYGASAYATLSQSGEVYFESICMFTFLLLLGKYLEFRARLKASEFTANLQKLMPLTARVIQSDGSEQIVAAKTLILGNIIRIKAGETIPADGLVREGQSSVDEAMMTGEHHPVTKQNGCQVYAGTVNNDGVLSIEVNRLGKNTLLNQIIQLQQTALEHRPKLALVTDKVAQWFVATLLVVATITAVYWYQTDAEHAFWITISVLVATCPCALSLAIPTALTCAVANLTKRGILIKSAHVLETMPKVTRVAFDKTGTLTEGRFSLVRTELLDPALDEQQLLMRAAELESYSEHPLARAFSDIRFTPGAFKDVSVVTGFGITGTENGQQWAIGKPDWFADTGHKNAQAALFIEQKPVALFYFDDTLRPRTAATVNALQQANIGCYMLTGDSSQKGPQLSKELSLDGCHKACLPDDKQRHVQNWVAEGNIVAMVGDGVNDSPVFSSAHLSVAMETGADISKNTADVVLLNSDIGALSALLNVARQTRRIVKQNLLLSLCYNLLILPLAAMGYVAPWMAVIGMSASSILVISNSLRLLKS